VKREKLLQIKCFNLVSELFYLGLAVTAIHSLNYKLFKLRLYCHVDITRAIRVMTDLMTHHPDDGGSTHL
jgi:hypothetical protein